MKPTSTLRRPNRGRIAQLLERGALGQGERPQPCHAREREAQRVHHTLALFFGGERRGLMSAQGMEGGKRRVTGRGTGAAT